MAAISNSLYENTAKTVISAFVTSHLDYGNSLYYGLFNKHLNKLQTLHNAAAKVVMKKRKFDHISDDFIKLHWLPVRDRIDHKIGSLTWKCINGQGPYYLSELLQPVDRNELRYKYVGSLKVPKTNQATCGDRAFMVAAPKVWNSIPTNIRTADSQEVFKSKHKTHLFIKRYGAVSYTHLTLPTIYSV